MKLLAFYIINSLANARVEIGSGKNQVDIPIVAADDNAVANIMNTVYLWAGIVAVFAVVIGGMLYVFSQGQAANIQRAKNTILYGIVGLVVVMLAFAITQLVLYVST